MKIQATAIAFVLTMYITPAFAWYPTKCSQADYESLNSIEGTETSTPYSHDNNLVGTDGDDYINGKTGNDVLDGLGGDDVYLGHTGVDRFVIRPEHRSVRIVDFRAGMLGNPANGAILGRIDYIDLRAFEHIDSVGDFYIRIGQCYDQNGQYVRTVNIQVPSLIVENREDFNDLRYTRIMLVGNFRHQVDDGIFILHGDPDPPTQPTRQSEASCPRIVRTGRCEARYNVSTHLRSTGSDNNDSFGANLDDTLETRGGHDYLDGWFGDDLLLGGSGNDVLVGGPGADELRGGSGTDTADYRFSDGVNVYLDGGYGKYSDAEGDTLTNIENLTGGKWNDKLYGDDGVNILRGKDGNDYLYGRPGNDILYGGEGNDTYKGQRGDDTYVITPHTQWGQDSIHLGYHDGAWDSDVVNVTAFGSRPTFGECVESEEDEMALCLEVTDGCTIKLDSLTRLFFPYVSCNAAIASLKYADE